MFCNQCGSQIPDNASICSNCGASVAQNQTPQQPLNQQPLNQQPFNQQPVNQQPVNQQFNPQMAQNQPTFNPQQGQPMYNGQPMQGYGMPVQQQSNPLSFITAKHPGVPFPLKGIFSGKTLLSKITTIDLIGVIAAIVAFICAFLPFLSEDGESMSLMSEEVREIGLNAGWFLLVVSVVMLVTYALRMEVLSWILSIINLLVFIHAWTFGAVIKVGVNIWGASIHYGVGFYFYLLATIAALIAPFIWSKLKKD